MPVKKGTVKAAAKESAEDTKKEINKGNIVIEEKAPDAPVIEKAEPKKFVEGSELKVKKTSPYKFEFKFEGPWTKRDYKFMMIQMSKALRNYMRERNRTVMIEGNTGQ